ncbi:aldo/keto reductase [Lentzea sp. NPDC059081]|uniref:aldo/keto reductase n=1 Tax=Lentzea sp. NPDC059081 TaxID=3346719 RepID=UPI0036B090EA
MKKRALPHSDIEVSRLGLGTSTWGFSGSDDDSLAQLRSYADAGGTLIETANIYGQGESERIIGRALSREFRRDDFVIATKAGLVIGKPPTVDASKPRMLAELENSLRNLQVDHVDLWLVHIWDQHVPIEETLSAIDTAVAAGKVRAAGLCNYSGWQTSQAATIQRVRGATPISAVEVEYSLLQRGIDREVRPAAKALGIGVLPWAPLGRGVLTGKYLHGVPDEKRSSGLYRWYVSQYAENPELAGIVTEVVDCARELGASPIEVSLAWVRDRPGVCAPLVGARTAQQLTASLSSEALELPAEITERLDKISALRLGYPERGLGR